MNPAFGMVAGVGLLVLAAVFAGLALKLLRAPAGGLPTGPDMVEGVVEAAHTAPVPVGAPIAWGRVEAHAVVPAHQRDRSERLLADTRGDPGIHLRTDDGRSVAVTLGDVGETFYGFSPEVSESDRSPEGVPQAPGAARSVVVEVVAVRPGDRLLAQVEDGRAVRIWAGGREASMARRASHAQTGFALGLGAAAGAVLCAVGGLVLLGGLL